MNEQQRQAKIEALAQELYLEWCNNPETNINTIIAKGMREALEMRLEDELLIREELAKDIKGLASAFVLTESEVLTHLINLGKLVAGTDVYIKNKSGAFVELGEIE